jgi:hypothetical protein
MANARAQEGQPARGKGTSWPSKVFALDPAGLHWPRAVLILDIMLVPLIVFLAIGHEEYLLSALFAAVADREAASGPARRGSRSSR